MAAVAPFTDLELLAVGAATRGPDGRMRMNRAARPVEMYPGYPAFVVDGDSVRGYWVKSGLSGGDWRPVASAYGLDLPHAFPDVMAAGRMAAILHAAFLVHGGQPVKVYPRLPAAVGVGAQVAA